MLPADIDPRSIPRAVRAELRGVSKETADFVGPHLVMAGELIDTDPELAYRHAAAAKRRASRLPVTREAVAETAYAAGLFDTALTEFRALRRLTGSPEFLPVLADCERALGRHQAALRIIAEGEAELTDPALLVELNLVHAGIRADMGQADEARRLLKKQLDNPQPNLPREAAARLRYAYAQLILDAGDRESARSWFESAARLDPEGETDASDRVDELDGIVLEVEEEDLDDEDIRAEAEAERLEAQRAAAAAEPEGPQEVMDQGRGPGRVAIVAGQDVDEADQLPVAVGSGESEVALVGEARFAEPDETPTVIPLTPDAADPASAQAEKGTRPATADDVGGIASDPGEDVESDAPAPAASELVESVDQASGGEAESDRSVSDGAGDAGTPAAVGDELVESVDLVPGGEVESDRSVSDGAGDVDTSAAAGDELVESVDLVPGGEVESDRSVSDRVEDTDTPAPAADEDMPADADMPADEDTPADADTPGSSPTNPEQPELEF